MKNKILLSIVTLLLFTASAFAKTVDLSKITDTYVAQNDDVLEGKLSGNYKISIADRATVTLNGVTINGVNDKAYQWAGITCEGDCKIILAENSMNIVKCFYGNYPGIYVPEGKILTISGGGTLDVSGGIAGIGSIYGTKGGGIVITGGVVTASGVLAGIGGTVESVTISGGVVTAIGGAYGTGIGSEADGTIKNITISDGVVTATGGDECCAGIGSGYKGTVESITISGGVVTATGGRREAGIGSGHKGRVNSITISGGVVTATGGEYGGAGIGSGYDGSTVESITISGGGVTAKSGGDGAGIGSGYHGAVENIIISGGVVTAGGMDRTIGIGSGNCASVGNITITDEVTRVTAIDGIGAGDGARTGKIIIGGKEYKDIWTSPFVYPTLIAEYPAVHIGEYNSGIGAVIDADYSGEETVSVPDPIEVDAIVYNRALTPLTPATTVLPFKLPDGTTLNAKFYYVKKVEQVGCSWNATMKYIGDGKLPAANTPYAVILNKGESKLKFDMHGKQATVQTGDIADQTDATGNWLFKGLYSYRVWRNSDVGDKNEIGLAYGFAGSNEEGIAKGEFGRIVDGAYAVPMRSYLRKASDKVVLENCKASTPSLLKSVAPYHTNYASAESGVINVNFVEDDDSGEEKTTGVGHLDSATGEIKIDRWYDLKGRRVNNVKRAAKGAYYGKKVLKK